MTFLDLIEIYNLRSGRDLDDITAIFENIDIDSRVDINVLATTILDECGAMRCIYDTSPTFKVFSDNFFKKYKESITRILDALEIEYSPLESVNFNWTESTNISQNLDTDENTVEDRTKTNTGTQTTNRTGGQTTESNGNTVTENTGTVGDSGSEENTVSAMNASTYQPDSYKTNSNTRTNNLTEDETEHSTEEIEENRTELVTDNKTEGIDANNTRTKNEQLTWTETDTHTEKGSKGFAYQDLIQKELKIRNFSIYGWIAKKYASELFILVY